jgi:hypothetical protein
MAAVIRSNVRAILLAIQAEVLVQSGLVSDQIMISVLEPQDVPHFNAAQEVIIQVLNEGLVDNVANYSGRVDDRRVRTLRFACRTRLLLDQSGQDFYRLTDASLGHLALEDAVYDAVRCFMPTDDLENAIGLPVRGGPFSQPRRERADDSWVVSTFTADVEYSRDLDQDRQ